MSIENRCNKTGLFSDVRAQVWVAYIAPVQSPTKQPNNKSHHGYQYLLNTDLPQVHQLDLPHSRSQWLVNVGCVQLCVVRFLYRDIFSSSNYITGVHPQNSCSELLTSSPRMYKTQVTIGTEESTKITKYFFFWVKRCSNLTKYKFLQL